MQTDKIRVKIRCMDSNTYPLTVDKSMKISDLKKLIEKKTSINPSYQRLVRGGKELKNDHLLSEYGTLSLKIY